MEKSLTLQSVISDLGLRIVNANQSLDDALSAALNVSKRQVRDWRKSNSIKYQHHTPKNDIDFLLVYVGKNPGKAVLKDQMGCLVKMK